MLDFERKKKQKIIVKFKASANDEFLNYAQVIDQIKIYYKKQQFHTLEESLNFMSLQLKKDFPSLDYLKMAVFKPHIIKNAKVGLKMKKKY